MVGGSPVGVSGSPVGVSGAALTYQIEIFMYLHAECGSAGYVWHVRLMARAPPAAR